MSSTEVRTIWGLVRRERHFTRVLLAAGLVLLCAPLGAAQVVVATVRDSATNDPVPYAIASLESVLGARVVAALTDARGIVTLPAPVAGTFRLRVDRAGLRGWRGDFHTIGVADTLRLSVAVSAEAQSLAAVTVVSTSTCVADPAAGDIGTVWEAARGALFAAKQGVTQGPPTIRVETFVRFRDLNERIVAEELEARVVQTAQPFRTLPPHVLSRDGYRLAGGETDLLFAPDANTLLSEEFARDHCFRLVADPRATELIGLAFSPSPGREVVDITGTFWLDRETSALRRVDYFYRNLGILEEAAGAGGRLEFGTLAGGIPAITAWTVRTARVASTRPANLRSRTFAPEDTLVGVREEGARLVEISGNELQPFAASGAISGEVIDRSARSGGLEGARVVVLGTPLGVRTDSLGRFSFENVRVGQAIIRVDHERLRLFRVRSRFEVDVREGEIARVSLEVPTGEIAYAAVCPGRPGVEGRGALVGRVVDADLGHAVSNAAVLATWRGRIIPTVVRTGAERTESDEFGHLTICDLSSAVRVRLTVTASGYRQRQMNLTVPASGVAERSIELEACRPSDDARICP